MYYILNEKHEVIPASRSEWSEMIASDECRRVAEDSINGKWVSTIFLGADYSVWNGPPLLFETAVFNDGEWHVESFDLYYTWNEAVEGHKKAIKWVENGCKDE